MMETPTEITFDQIKGMLPEKTYLRYVDYQDSLEGYEKKIQEAIHKRDISLIWDSIDDAFSEQEWDSIDDYKKKLANDIQEEYDLEEDEAERIVENHEDSIRDVLYDRDQSDCLSDLIRNTGDIIAFYDTGFYMEEGSWSWGPMDIYQMRRKIKALLSIKTKDYDAALDMMIREASYGGNLQIYFVLDLKDFFDGIDGDVVTFSNAHIGIVDSYNGSGDTCKLPRHTFSLPFNPENIFLEKNIKYNWTYSIAGMYSDWCDSTGVDITKKKRKGGKTIGRSSLHGHLSKEEAYNRTYKEGGCTFGDMDITRHRNTSYINNIPCGTKCRNCGTFWID